jgi:hypothetical protein
MVGDDLPTSLTRLTFHGPLSEERASGRATRARIRKQVDEHRSYWLRGYRGILGQAYLTLVPVG